MIVAISKHFLLNKTFKYTFILISLYLGQKVNYVVLILNVLSTMQKNLAVSKISGEC